MKKQKHFGHLYTPTRRENSCSTPVSQHPAQSPDNTTRGGSSDSSAFKILQSSFFGPSFSLLFISFACCLLCSRFSSLCEANNTSKESSVSLWSFLTPSVLCHTKIKQYRPLSSNSDAWPGPCRYTCQRTSWRCATTRQNNVHVALLCEWETMLRTRMLAVTYLSVTLPQLSDEFITFVWVQVSRQVGVHAELRAYWSAEARLKTTNHNNKQLN